MIVNVETIEFLEHLRKDINTPLLSDIEFYQNDKPINIPKEYVEEFDLTGLNNMDFITSGFYKRGWDKKAAPE